VGEIFGVVIRQVHHSFTKSRVCDVDLSSGSRTRAASPAAVLAFSSPRLIGCVKFVQEPYSLGHGAARNTRAEPGLGVKFDQHDRGKFFHQFVEANPTLLRHLT